MPYLLHLPPPKTTPQSPHPSPAHPAIPPPSIHQILSSELRSPLPSLRRYIQPPTTQRSPFHNLRYPTAHSRRIPLRIIHLDPQDKVPSLHLRLFNPHRFYPRNFRRINRHASHLLTQLSRWPCSPAITCHHFHQPHPIQENRNNEHPPRRPILHDRRHTIPPIPQFQLR